MAEIANREVIANEHGLTKGQNMATIVQLLLDDDTIGRVRVLEGDYLLSQKINIPIGKQLILTGDNGSNYVLSANDLSPTLFTKVTPTFTDGFCYEVNDKTALIGGFTDCSVLNSGGGILLDFSLKIIHAVRLKTVIFGGYKFDLEAIKLNGDRPTGTSPGYAYYLDIDCGISGFGWGVHLKRLDLQTALTSDSDGLAWINGLNIKGNMQRCQRYVHFNTSHNGHAGGSSYIAPRLQGGSVPDPNLPAVELGGDDTTLAVQFHDISANHSQKIRYQFKEGSTNFIIHKSRRTSAEVIDPTTNHTYLQQEPITTFTQLDDGTTVSDGWYIRQGKMVTYYFRTTITDSTSWAQF